MLSLYALCCTLKVRKGGNCFFHFSIYPLVCKKFLRHSFKTNPHRYSCCVHTFYKHNKISPYLYANKTFRGVFSNLLSYSPIAWHTLMWSGFCFGNHGSMFTKEHCQRGIVIGSPIFAHCQDTISYKTAIVTEKQAMPNKS